MSSKTFWNVVTCHLNQNWSEGEEVFFFRWTQEWLGRSLEAWGLAPAPSLIHSFLLWVSVIYRQREGSGDLYSLSSPLFSNSTKEKIKSRTPPPVLSLIKYRENFSNNFLFFYIFLYFTNTKKRRKCNCSFFTNVGVHGK